jgi:hypothetical protein
MCRAMVPQRALTHPEISRHHGDPDSAVQLVCNQSQRALYLPARPPRAVPGLRLCGHLPDGSCVVLHWRRPPRPRGGTPNIRSASNVRGLSRIKTVSRMQGCSA